MRVVLVVHPARSLRCPLVSPVGLQCVHTLSLLFCSVRACHVSSPFHMRVLKTLKYWLRGDCESLLWFDIDGISSRTRRGSVRPDRLANIYKRRKSWLAIAQKVLQKDCSTAKWAWCLASAVDENVWSEQKDRVACRHDYGKCAAQARPDFIHGDASLMAMDRFLPFFITHTNSVCQCTPTS